MFLTSTDISVIILGGLSLRNIARTERIEEYFTDNARNVKRLFYKHRKENHESIDMQHEIRELHKILSSYTPDQHIVIIAKSIWCTLLLHTLETYPEFQRLNMRCVFMWFPSASAQRPSLAERFPMLEGYVLQNRNDPVATYEEIVPVFAWTKFKTIELPGDTHHYELQDVEHLNLSVFEDK